MRSGRIGSCHTTGAGAWYRLALRCVRVALKAFEVRAKLRSGLATHVAILLQTFLNNFFEAWRNVVIDAGRRSRCTIENIAKDDAGSVAAKWQLTRRHLVKHHAKGKKVGARIEFLAANLFGRHVSDGPDSAAGTGQELIFNGASFSSVSGHRVRRFRTRGNFCQPEIENLGMAAFSDENVCRFDVAVNDSPRVSSFETSSDINGNIEKFFGIHQFGA